MTDAVLVAVTRMPAVLARIIADYATILAEMIQLLLVRHGNIDIPLEPLADAPWHKHRVQEDMTIRLEACQDRADVIVYIPANGDYISTTIDLLLSALKSDARPRPPNHQRAVLAASFCATCVCPNVLHCIQQYVGVLWSEYGAYIAAICRSRDSRHKVENLRS